MPSYPHTDLHGLPRLAPFDTLRRSINQVFVDFTRDVGFRPIQLDAAQYDFRPVAECHETGTKMAIRIELPGVVRADISVKVTDDLFEVSGEKRAEREIIEGDEYRSELSFGSFYRCSS